MKLGIDIDGVLCDFITPLLKRWNGIHNTNYRVEEITHFHQITEWGIEYNLWDYTSCKVMPGAVETLEKLNQEHDLYIVTARPVHTAVVTYDWLMDHFPFLQERQVIMCYNKQLLNLDCLVDDGPHNLEGFEYPIIFNQPWNRDANYWRADNWKQVYDIVKVFNTY